MCSHTESPVATGGGEVRRGFEGFVVLRRRVRRSVK